MKYNIPAFEITVGMIVFVKGGFRNSNRYVALDKHGGGIRNLYNEAQEKYNFFFLSQTTILWT